MDTKMTSPTAATSSAPAPVFRTTPGLAALAGIVAAAAALAVGELVAAFVAGAPSPVASVGAALIDFAPPGSKEVVVGLFGTNDKPALLLLVTAAVLAVGAGLGVLARSRMGAALAGVFALVLVGLLAMLRMPGASLPMSVLSAAIAGGVGSQVLVMLMAAAPTGAPEERPDPRSGVRLRSRRGFLLRAGGIGALAVVGGGVGRALVSGRAAEVAGASTEIPAPVSPVQSPDPSSSFEGIAGLSPLVVPNADFYRIDTALVTPSVKLEDWTLRVHGMVRNELTLTFADLLELPLVEQYVTIACVSNEVGGRLVGNAKWTGVRLMDVLDQAEILPGATQIVPRSVDGWTAGFPTEWVTAPERPREALIAVQMNGEPLPAEHGFPARLIVPGLYGYVSATKWLSDIELTTLEAFDAYWVPRGWAKEAPILTQSRIDVPSADARVTAGTVAVAGVAWAPDRGISRVEVRIDEGDWQNAEIATPIGPQTWVQWKLAWRAEPGEHVITVRATDGTGTPQEDRFTTPDPDGARGYHAIRVTVA